MWGSQPEPVAEHEATGRTAAIYHEIKQTLRVSGVNLNFRTWAAFPHFFHTMWPAMQPIAASRTFERASDALRTRAASLACELPRVESGASPGESQHYQIEQALALYHYVNPKLLLFTVIVRRGLTGERRPPRGISATADTVPFGAPARMAAMEMVDESPSDRRLRRLLRDIKKTLRLSAVNSDYRTLALWPDYLEPAWSSLKPIVRGKSYALAADALAQAADDAADGFTPPPALDIRRLKAKGEKTTTLVETTERFEQLLPPLILNIALLGREWWSDERLRESPFPVEGATQGEGFGAPTNASSPGGRMS